MAGTRGTKASKGAATTVRLDRAALKRLDTIAKARRRSRNSIIGEAIASFVAYDKWFVEEVKKGMRAFKRGDVISQEEIVKKWESRVEARVDSQRE
jgi:predicted transcriptional regulator